MGHRPCSLPAGPHVKQHWHLGPKPEVLRSLADVEGEHSFAPAGLAAASVRGWRTSVPSGTPFVRCDLADMVSYVGSLSFPSIVRICSAISSNTAFQLPCSRWRNRRAVGYQGLSERSSSQRQSALLTEGLPAPRVLSVPPACPPSPAAPPECVRAAPRPARSRGLRGGPARPRWGPARRGTPWPGSPASAFRLAPLPLDFLAFAEITARAALDLRDRLYGGYEVLSLDHLAKSELQVAILPRRRIVRLVQSSSCSPLRLACSQPSSTVRAYPEAHPD